MVFLAEKSLLLFGKSQQVVRKLQPTGDVKTCFWLLMVLMIYQQHCCQAASYAGAAPKSHAAKDVALALDPGRGGGRGGERRMPLDEQGTLGLLLRFMGGGRMSKRRSPNKCLWQANTCNHWADRCCPGMECLNYARGYCLPHLERCICYPTVGQDRAWS